jgi:hypothetical protein
LTRIDIAREKTETNITDDSQKEKILWLLDEVEQIVNDKLSNLSDDTVAEEVISELLAE